MTLTELWIDRADYRNTRIVEKPAPELGEGEILVAIDKYGLTANNVTYAVSGDMIGYWKFFPAADNWGKVPVWGMADVTASNCESVEVGERLYGYFPMASHLVMQPGKIRGGSFIDAAEHRQVLPELYNNYSRTDGEPDFLKALENERCLYFPLFVTSFVLSDLLEDNDFYEADQVLIGSVSSKTGFGLAAFLKSVSGFKGKVVGLTSEGNKAFVERLGYCDQIITYGNESELKADQKSVYVDMSGNGALRRTLHEALGENMVRSIGVGATHWEEERGGGKMPGAKPEFFFAPSQIGKRNTEWGPGIIFKKAYGASAQLASEIKDEISVDFLSGPEAARDIWVDMVDNKVPPKRGIMISF